jgi:hypothetical protein
MESLPIPKTLKVYQLLKMTGAYISGVSASTPNSLSMGIGFYLSLQEAEHMRTLEILKDTTAAGLTKPTWHIFELEFPNPAYTE